MINVLVSGLCFPCCFIVDLFVLFFGEFLFDLGVDGFLWFVGSRCLFL